jgi:hypothetical protein
MTRVSVVNGALRFKSMNNNEQYDLVECGSCVYKEQLLWQYGGGI